MQRGARWRDHELAAGHARAGRSASSTDPAKRRLRLAPRPGSVLSYRVRSEDGTVAWSDTSPRQPKVLFTLAALTRQVAKGDCHLAR